MTRLLKFSDAALAARLHALRLSAAELQARLQAVAETEQSGRKAPADGSWKRLSALLRRVQAELNEAQGAGAQTTCPQAARKASAADPRWAHVLRSRAEMDHGIARFM
jgi:hypothetical protein